MPIDMTEERESELPSQLPALTERQQAVMELIDRRVPIKMIAQELGVSETRINQHIRALKDIFEVASLNELVETYRSGRNNDEENGEDSGNSDAASDQIEKSIIFGADQDHLIIDEAKILNGSLNDALDHAELGRFTNEPGIIRRLLDGGHSPWERVVAIVGVAFGVLVTFFLMIYVAIALGEFLQA